MKNVSTPAAPEARGHYSQAIVHGGMVYVAGQLPGVPGDPERRLESFEDQARQVLANVAAILEAAGTSLEHVVKATVYLKDFSEFAAMNSVYREYFPTEPPTRATVGVTSLAADYRVEIEVIATR